MYDGEWKQYNNTTENLIMIEYRRSVQEKKGFKYYRVLLLFLELFLCVGNRI